MGPHVANNDVKIQPEITKGIDQYCEMVCMGADFFLVKTRKPLNAAKAPKVISRGSGGAFNNKVIPITIPIKLNGSNQLSSFLSAASNDFVPK